MLSVPIKREYFSSSKAKIQNYHNLLVTQKNLKSQARKKKIINLCPGPYNVLSRARREYYEKNGNNEEYGSKCFCCPYGYHIDLDFVRYCETWQTDASDRLQDERRRRRARHKQRQSMEFLLGLPDEEVREDRQLLHICAL